MPHLNAINESTHVDLWAATAKVDCITHLSFKESNKMIFITSVYYIESEREWTPLYMARVGTQLMWVLGRLMLTNNPKEGRLKVAVHPQKKSEKYFFVTTSFKSVQSDSLDQYYKIRELFQTWQRQFLFLLFLSFDGEAAASALAVTMGTGAHCSEVVYGSFRGNLIPVKCGSRRVNHFKRLY